MNSFIPDIHNPTDIKLTSHNIVVLTHSNPCVHFYDYSHQLTKQIITQGVGEQVSRPWRFYLDKESNILMTDISANCVLIFSNTGQLIHKIGKKGDSQGEFIRPRGIVLDYKNRIIVTSENPDHSIQMF